MAASHYTEMQALVHKVAAQSADTNYVMAQLHSSLSQAVKSSALFGTHANDNFIEAADDNDDVDAYCRRSPTGLSGMQSVGCISRANSLQSQQSWGMVSSNKQVLYHVTESVTTDTTCTTQTCMASRAALAVSPSMSRPTCPSTPVAAGLWSTSRPAYRFVQTLSCKGGSSTSASKRL